MSLITDTWHQLVQRRLLPVAVLLLAALVAVPLLLAKDPEPVAAPVVKAPEADGADAAVAEPVVTLVEQGTPERRRRVLGARKNPFEPAPYKAPEDATASSAGEPANSGASAPSPSGSTVEDSAPSTGGGSGAPAGDAPSAAPAPQAPVEAAPRKRYELLSLTVRFGDSSSDSLEKSNLARLKPLPSAENPILVYLGVSGDRKSALFLVDGRVEAQGDGSCKPSPVNCETISMREGDTEFFDVVGEDGTVEAQYQLDLVDIKRGSTASASKAAAAKAKESPAGRRVLRAHRSAHGPLRYRYDAESGTVRKLPARAYKALVSRLAKVAATFTGDN